ncbi:MAG: right-handed parallel beta-helix repeat-containing protein [Pyrinomonadaceae bacterium]
MKRAREIQTESKTTDIKLINIEIAAGIYAESVAVKLSWIRLRGAGAGVSMIQSPGGPAVLVSSAQPVFFEGLTMSSLNSTGLGAINDTFIGVSGCEFRDSRTGIALFTQSSAEVTSSTFSNNNNSVVAVASSTALLFDSVITGKSTNQGSGVIIGDGGMGELENVSISQTRTGVAVYPNATLFTFGGLNISNNRIGCFVAGSSYLELSDSTVSNNSSVGVLLDLGSSAGMFSMTLNNNGTAISVNGNSYVDIGNSEVKFNNLGIGFDLFGKGVLRQVDVSNNTSNTQTSRGGEFFAEP